MYAKVIVDIVHENVAQAYTYRVPDGLQLSEGQRVEVPFGYQVKEGIVISLPEETDVPPDKLRTLTRTLDTYPAVLPQLIRLAERMAEHAHCPLAETLRLMIPAEMRGDRVHVRTRQMIGLTVPEAEIDRVIEAQGRSQKRRMLIRLLSDGQTHPLDELKLLVQDPMPALRKLEEDGVVVFRPEEVLRIPGGTVWEQTTDPTLTISQQEVLEELLPALKKGKGCFLLHGVTGSGKTEVFIRLVRQTLQAGKSAMILVPEIALTPQMVNWFRSRFGEVAAVLHSRLSAGERYDEWRRIRRGDARVVIGARSAVFAPCDQLGLIVVDEEHESTYYSDRSPRYDAREVARWRCEAEGAVLVLASATPSILSFAQARRGDYTLLEMPTRVGNHPMPSVEIADMRRELEKGNRSIFSGALYTALKECLAKGEQCMLLMNRRGYHSFVSCRSCGTAIKCPNCDISMTYHLGGSDDSLHCHYCGHIQPIPRVCPSCGSRYIKYFGIGTQRVEEELKKLFPGTGIVRMDVDTTSGKDGHAKLLDEFRSGRARIMVGTQMIAKGHDFPRVTLVGIVAADTTLNLPDYRSRERTFQLLTQAAGRAGRGDIPGRVIIQTYKPEDPTINYAAAQDYRSFFEAEFARRRSGLYPPFTVMARLLVEAVHGQEAQQHASALYDRCQALLEAHPAWQRRTLICRLDRPGIAVLRGKNRWHVMFRFLVHPDTEEFVRELSQMAREKCPGVDTWFEYNPTTMM